MWVWFTHMQVPVPLCFQMPEESISVFLHPSLSATLRQSLSLNLHLGLSDSLAASKRQRSLSHRVGFSAVHKSTSVLVGGCWPLNSAHRGM